MHEIPRYHGHGWMRRTKQFFVLGFVLFFLAAIGLYVHSGRFVARHIYLQDQLIEGFSREEVSQLIKDRIETLKAAEIVLLDGDKTYRVTAGELGIQFDASKTAQRIFDLGRSLWLKAQVISASKARQKHFVKPVSEVDPKAVRTQVAQILARGEYPAQNAKLVWSKDSGWGIQLEGYGRALLSGELDRITPLIVEGIYDPKEKKVRARYKEVSPTVRASELGDMLERVKRLTQAPITVKLGKIKEVIEVASNPSSWVAFNYQAKTVQMNPDQAAIFAREFADRHDITPSTVLVKSLSDHLSEYVNEFYKKAVIEGEFRAGRRVDQAALVKKLGEVFVNADKREVEVPFETVPATIRSEVEGFEFPERISVGQSIYRLGNYPNRVHNIKKGLETENLVVINPGETFSYNKVLGWVTLEKGYQKAKVIFGDTLSEAAGGGICQTSTTMFRAAVNGGLPIVARRNHTWDVVYYQDWYGVDAAVYPPGKLDLMFTNDTPGPILIHAYTDDDLEIAYFELYGTSDGREVRFNTVENVPVGRGRRVVTDWEVIKPGGIIEKRQIVSKYRR